MNQAVKSVMGVLVDPIGTAIHHMGGDNNKLTNFLAPVQALQKNVKDGSGINLKSVGDPGSLFNPSKQQADKAAADQQAANAAALAAVPSAPNQDVAANNAAQQADQLRRRRGVLANIFAGANSGNSQTGQKSTLG